jgi:hypothetical protein
MIRFLALMRKSTAMVRRGAGQFIAWPAQLGVLTALTEALRRRPSPIKIGGVVTSVIGDPYQEGRPTLMERHAIPRHVPVSLDNFGR